MSAATATRVPSRSFGTRVADLLKRRETSVVIAIVVVVALATSVNRSFAFGSDGFRNLLLTPSLLVVLSVAQAIVLISKNVDLSVSAVLGLTAYATGDMFTLWPSLPIPVVVVLAIAFGSVLGAINGLLVSVARVPALVITLGTLYIYRGMGIAWVGSGHINPSDVPNSFERLGVASVFGIPILTLVALAVVIVVAYVMGSTRSGRELYAIGSDEDAADLYGLRVRRRVFFAFLSSGTLAGLAGVMYAARYVMVDSQAGAGLELQAVAGAVVGGVAIAGGSGTVLGAALGAVLLTTIARALPIVGVPDFWQQAVVGVLIIAAIVLDKVLAIRNVRRLAAERERQLEGVA
ncbi:ABC transporter permease [Actinotalea sp. M2MS4P-6]|uniref:ABC transporter permease n=1 Tax=Actinotalea sp. M2MS4P-6 TaxID=2983762 RepID=UPI0021E43BE6|nr:ABC transporter permease [Actinotalea sp. M2MS4P-6]MCV2394187.1 ABC transporter permease [Actinotalea sp. M2MS4P-6]